MTDKAKILFVDDEKRILTALRAIFRSDYQVFTANSGAEALTIICQEQIHAIISDQRMPLMLGHELLHEVKQLSPNTMRLLLTGYSDLSSIMSSINDGEVFRFIHKPWSVDEIRATVASAVDIAKMTMNKVPAVATEAVEQTEYPDVLVLDDQAAMHSLVQAILPVGVKVHSAHNISQAMGILDREEIAILLTDVTVAGEDTTDLIKLLKLFHPLVITIVLTDAADAHAAVQLINQGQIFRYLNRNRPAGDKGLQESIHYGLEHYAKNKQRPELLQRHRVEAPTTENNPSLVERIGSQLRSLRNRFRYSFV